jgi:cellulose synthase/poly-beta-1,6-N-acetylglucosamine synthase-like glycosyltransferase
LARKSSERQNPKRLRRPSAREQSRTRVVYKPPTPPGVSIITCTNRPSRMENVILSYLRQNYQPKELIIVLNNNDMRLQDWQARVRGIPAIKVLQADERISLGECYNFAVGQASHDYVAKFDDDDYYAPNFLSGEMSAFNYTCADIVGKSCRFIYFLDISTLGFHEASPQFSYVPYVIGATMIVRKEVFKHIKFRDITIGEDSEFQKDCQAAGRKIFSVDKYNYVTIRHHSTEPHTNPLDDQEYLSYCLRSWKTRDYITPITR